MLANCAPVSLKDTNIVLDNVRRDLANDRVFALHAHFRTQN
jgi:hypothetical protein